MEKSAAYISAIPDHSREEDISGKPGSVHGKVVKNYYVGRTLVGRREFTTIGRLEYECSFKNGKKHGWEYKWHQNGLLSSAVPFAMGREHGIASVWGQNGNLLGSYQMAYGSGVDLWWVELDNNAQLSEARSVIDNLSDGYEYWFRWFMPGVLWKEKWWYKGDLHGVEREWNNHGRLRRGFPKYWIHGKQVDKRKYDRAVKLGVTLRPYRVEDNLPDRVFPQEVAVNLA